MTKQRSLPIIGMHCASCAADWKTQENSGCHGSVNYGSEQATVDFDEK